MACLWKEEGCRGPFVMWLVNIFVVGKNKPHLFLFPSTNPTTAGRIGSKALINVVKGEWGISNLWSVGFERNPDWVRVPVDRIVPIP